MPKEEIEKEEKLNPEIEKDLKKYEDTNFKSLIDQINTEYTISWFYMKPKIDEWGIRLKIYNNQKRDKTAIGDPLIFTVHQTVLASLYNDRLAVSFLGREEGDEEVAENLDNLAEFDYDEMEKSMIDYEWDWDSSFFGRGLLSMYEFDRERKCPVPEVIDPMTWLRDPRAKSINGSLAINRKRKGAMRFGGRPISLTKQKMRDSKGLYFNFGDIKPTGRDPYSLLDSASEQRASAQGLGDTLNGRADNIKGDNAEIKLLEWYTTWKGKKCIVTLTEDRKKVVRYTELKDSIWKIVDRPLYPIAHDWDGVSVPDLIEDKQRARAIIQNLALKSIKVNLEPRLLYNTNKIKNRKHLDVEFLKHIPVDGDTNNTITPVQSNSVKLEAQWILDVLDTASQRATATPTMQQGINSTGQKTATEVNRISEGVDVRYSLSAKIWGWSEKTFWQQWYFGYKTHFKEGIDDKIIRLSGILGAKWRKLTRENIIAHKDPDIKIESKVISEAIQFNELQKYRLFLKDVLASPDGKTANIRSALRKIGTLSGFPKDMINQVLPLTVDELNAESENERLDAGKLVNVEVYDNDVSHLEIHNKAADTPQKKAHINAHKKAMMLKKIRPEFDVDSMEQPLAEPEQAGVSFANMQGGKGIIGAQSGTMNNLEQ